MSSRKYYLQDSVVTNNQERTASSTTYNLLELIPVRNTAWFKTDDGKATLVVPRFRSRFGRKFCKLIKKPLGIHIKLDEFGSTVWLLCNGKNTVKTIGKVLRHKYGSEIEPVYERIGKFLRQLEDYRFIKMLTFFCI